VAKRNPFAGITHGHDLAEAIDAVGNWQCEACVVGLRG
jgi:hypothetical protein